MDQRCICHLPHRHLVLFLLAHGQPPERRDYELELPHLRLGHHFCYFLLLHLGSSYLRGACRPRPFGLIRTHCGAGEALFTSFQRVQGGRIGGFRRLYVRFAVWIVPFHGVFFHQPNEGVFKSGYVNAMHAWWLPGIFQRIDLELGRALNMGILSGSILKNVTSSSSVYLV